MVVEQLSEMLSLVIEHMQNVLKVKVSKNQQWLPASPRWHLPSRTGWLIASLRPLATPKSSVSTLWGEAGGAHSNSGPDFGISKRRSAAFTPCAKLEPT